MTDREMNIALREMARQTGACSPILEGWSDEDTVDALAERYIKTLDFATGRDFPPLDFIRKHFRLEDLHRHNIYLDEKVDIEDAKNGIYVFLGACTGRIVFREYGVGTLYLRHETRLQVVSEDVSKVFVRLYELSDCDCLSNVRVYDRRK